MILTRGYYFLIRYCDFLGSLLLHFGTFLLAFSIVVGTGIWMFGSYVVYPDVFVCEGFVVAFVHVFADLEAFAV